MCNVFVLFWYSLDLLPSHWIGASESIKHVSSAWNSNSKNYQWNQKPKQLTRYLCQKPHCRRFISKWFCTQNAYHIGITAHTHRTLFLGLLIENKMNAVNFRGNNIYFRCASNFAGFFLPIYNCSKMWIECGRGVECKLPLTMFWSNLALIIKQKKQKKKIKGSLFYIYVRLKLLS